MKNKKGFTLIELLSVIVILSVLLIIAVPKIMNTIRNSKLSAIKSSAIMIASAVEKNISMLDTYSLTGSCMNIDNLDINEYDSCTYTINENEEAYITLKGTNTGKFSGLTCTGYKNNMNCTDIKITITFNSNEGNITYNNSYKKIDDYIITKEYNYNDILKDLPIVTKENKTFIGWFTSNDEIIKENDLITFNNNITLYAKYGETYTFNYTGDIQTFNPTISGYYLLETWGASGGSGSDKCYGGYGAYSVGYSYLEKNTTYYIVVGGSGVGGGTHGNKQGGYNGGGGVIADSDGNTRGASGGGATHISLKNGLLSELENDLDKILIISAGGGGGARNSVIGCVSGGSGGGIKGSDGGNYNESTQISGYGTGATQTEGGSYFTKGTFTGYSGTFGAGAGNKCHAGAGAGLYGGGIILYSGGGGSSYIGNTLLISKDIEKHMTCYNCTTSLNTDDKTISTENVSSTPISDYAKIGDGYAKITFISLN